MSILKNIAFGILKAIVKLCFKFSPEFKKEVVKTWLAFSVSHITFIIEDGRACLILGVIKNQKDKKIHEGVPNEDGEEYGLVGGFNGNLLEGPVQFSELGAAHDYTKLGIKDSKNIWGEYKYVEYSNEVCQKPMDHDFFGEIPLKRVAFNGLMLATQEILDGFKPSKAFAGIKKFFIEDFNKIILPNCRFPYQIELVLQGFKDIQAIADAQQQ